MAKATTSPELLRQICCGGDGELVHEGDDLVGNNIPGEVLEGLWRRDGSGEP